MKRYTVYLALFGALFLARSVQAQGRFLSDEEWEAAQTERIESTLNAIGLEGEKREAAALTMRTQGKKQRLAMAEARSSRDFQAMRKLMDTNRKETREMLSAILNEDELSKFDKHVESTRRQRPGNRPRGRQGVQ